MKVSSEKFDQAFYTADNALVSAIPTTFAFCDTVVRLAQGVNPEIFLLTFVGRRVEPAQAVFVGDSLRRDMVGDCAMGMTPDWVTSGKGQGKGACCPNDPVVNTLDGLQELLL